MNSRLGRRARDRRGFTLVELLITAGILLIMATMAVAVYSTTASSDRIRSSARQVQSAFGGARDRAIKSFRTDGSTRGLRLLVDATDPTTVTSMVYIGSDPPWSDGQVMIGREDLEDTDMDGIPDGNGEADNATVRTVRAWPKMLTDGSVEIPGWKRLYDQGLLVDGAKIKIREATGMQTYTVSTYLLSKYVGRGPEILVLTSDYRGTTLSNYPIGAYDKGPDMKFGSDGQSGLLADDDLNSVADNPQEWGAPNSDDVTDINAVSTPFDYELELKPSVLPGQEPLRLSSGIAIDLYNSRIPANWYQQRSLAKGSAAPPANNGWDSSAGYFLNGWGVWTIEGTDPSNTANDIWRQYSPRMDIMFSPSGSVTGPLTTIGMLHLRLAEVEDIVEMRDPANTQAAPMLYSTLFTQTGYLATFPVNLTDTSPADGIADDPLYFARTGGTAGR